MILFFSYVAKLALDKILHVSINETIYEVGKTEVIDMNGGVGLCQDST
jgi:hypothetical protein